MDKEAFLKKYDLKLEDYVVDIYTSTIYMVKSWLDIQKYNKNIDKAFSLLSKIHLYIITVVDSEGEEYFLKANGKTLLERKYYDGKYKVDAALYVSLENNLTAVEIEAGFKLKNISRFEPLHKDFLICWKINQ